MLCVLLHEEKLNPLLSSQCRTFSVNCTFVNGKIAAQMNAWSGTSCGTGEKCGYKVIGRCGVVWRFSWEWITSPFLVSSFSPLPQHTPTQITSQTANEIKGTHTTPVHHYVDDLTMAFTTSGSGCSVAVSYQLASYQKDGILCCTCCTHTHSQGFSTSETWYAVLDYGTNYCNLHNLVDGAKIDTSTYGFKEQTSDSQCTQYTSHNCDKY